MSDYDNEGLVETPIKPPKEKEPVSQFELGREIGRLQEEVKQLTEETAKFKASEAAAVQEKKDTEEEDVFVIVPGLVKREEAKKKITDDFTF